MRLTTLRDGSRDGRLHLVSRDGTRCVSTAAIAATMQEALDAWHRLRPALEHLAGRLERGDHPDILPFDPQRSCAPLPRAWQWCDASAFLNHVDLLTQAFKTPPIESAATVPLMYQGAADDLLGPHADVPLPSEADGIDVEGEFGVITTEVRMGASAQEALQQVALIVQINDWSLRSLGAAEIRTGMGFLQAKPSTSFAPLAVTPDELGDAWHDGRVHLDLHVDLDGEPLGHPNGREMNFSFGELIAHAARTRRLSAGTIVGSGTVSNRDRATGSSCIAERRMIEMIDQGQARTPFMSFGGRVQMSARYPDGRPGPFGEINQRVVPSPKAE